MGRCALNYIYLSKYHAGGKDQMALNLLEGIYKNGDSDKCIIFCYDYSVDIIRMVNPDIEIVSIESGIASGKKCSELKRLWNITMANTWKIPKLIKKYDVNVIFHASCTNGLRKMPVESVVIPHDIKAISHRVMGEVKVSFYKYLMYKIMYGMDFWHADKIVAISRTDKAEMQKYYPKHKDKIVQIYNPIKVDVNNYVRNNTSDKKNIVAINLQFHHKNIITLIKAFEKIKDRIEGNLLLVGVIPERVEYLRKYVKEHRLTDRVIFTGFLDGENKRKTLLDSALYVNPSLFEGFGMTAVEAMILKVPTLLSMVSANYEVTKGLCSYYEPASDEDALADAIIKCLSEPDDESTLEKKSNEMRKAYDYKFIARQYVDMFTEAGEL